MARVPNGVANKAVQVAQRPAQTCRVAVGRVCAAQAAMLVAIAWARVQAHDAVHVRAGGALWPYYYWNGWMNQSVHTTKRATCTLAPLI